MYTLAVIDPQLYCLPSKEDLPGYGPLLEVEREIATAKQLGCDIVIVIYPEMGPINPRINQLLRGYNRVIRVEKQQWIGARQLLAGCREFGFNTNFFRVCGWYTHRCLQTTVQGLSRALPNCRIQVVKKACDDIEQNRWNTFPKLNNVELV
ncbi:MAG TPA: hypothetical protein V6C81_13270 [Planktothrix sp.]|jgi:hypothetical protein